MSEIRIQDDLYNYVNHEWLEKAEIPADKPVAGGFAELQKEVERKLLNDFLEMSKTKQYPSKHLENAVKLFDAFKDVKKRNKLGIKPALKYLSKLYKLQNLSQFNRNLKEFVLCGYQLPFQLDVSANSHDTSKYCLLIMGPSTILPDSSYYKPEMAQQKEMMLGLWTNSATAILAQTKLTEEEQAKFLTDTIAFDEKIGLVVKSNEEWSDYINIFNATKTRTVASQLKPIKFRKLLVDLFGDVVGEVMVADTRWLKEFKTIFNEESFEEFKHWSYVTTLLNTTSFLSEQLRELGGTFMRTLMGVVEMESAEKAAYNLASNTFSDPVGLYYGEKYFGLAAKKDINEIVKSIIEQYKVRLKQNSVLSDETKQKAVIKLDKMVCKMGYPDKVDKIYDELVYNDELNVFENICNLRRITRMESFSRLFKLVDREEWHMPGHMVNACYTPSNNDITFPAGILQAPFYSNKQSRSENLGGIGAVIGHEISHAFDNNGSKCDEFGNIKNWWKKEDFKKFEKRTKEMIEEFDGIELPWGKVNGSFIVSENIADNGGMAVTLDIMKNTKDASYEEYFINWAKVWCLKAKPEYLQLILQLDVHAPNILRANMQPRNFPEWYETFNVKETDQMYIEPKKRVVIW